MSCIFCGKTTPEGHNYCDWTCHIEDAKKVGGVVHAPNGLPIRCIKHDNSMWEHEHGDHPDYMFPVEVEYVGNRFEPKEVQLVIYGKVLVGDELQHSRDQEHALIYTDSGIAVTLYESCYATWLLGVGQLVGGSLWQRGEWFLSKASVEKITERTKK